MKIFLTATEVAPLIGFANRTAFLNARDRLERENDFPLPMPTCRRPLLWRRDQVTAWVESCGTARTEIPQQPFLGASVALLAEARRA